MQIAVAGELDLSSALTFDEEVRRAEERRPQTLVLDLRRLRFMDSTGLQVLIRSALQVENRGRIVLRSPTHLVRSILELAVGTSKLPNLQMEG